MHWCYAYILHDATRQNAGTSDKTTLHISSSAPTSWLAPLPQSSQFLVLFSSAISEFCFSYVYRVHHKWNPISQCENLSKVKIFLSEGAFHGLPSHYTEVQFLSLDLEDIYWRWGKESKFIPRSKSKRLHPSVMSARDNPGWQRVEKCCLVTNIYTNWMPDEWWPGGNLWPGRAEMGLGGKQLELFPFYFFVAFNVKRTFKPLESRSTSICHGFHSWNGDTWFFFLFFLPCWCFTSVGWFIILSQPWGIHTWHHLWKEHIGVNREYCVEIHQINDIFHFLSVQNMELC